MVGGNDPYLLLRQGKISQRSFEQQLLSMLVPQKVRANRHDVEKKKKLRHIHRTHRPDAEIRRLRREYEGIRPALFREMLAQPDLRCNYCRNRLDDTTMTIDHVTSLSRGGTNDRENLVPSCSGCNQQRNLDGY